MNSSTTGSSETANGSAETRAASYPWVRSVLEEFNLLKKRQPRAEPFRETAWNALEASGLLVQLHDICHQINSEAGWVVLNEERLRRPHRRPARYVFKKEKVDYALGVEIGHNELRVVFRMRSMGPEPTPSYRRYFYRYVVRHLSEHKRIVLPLNGLKDLPVDQWVRYLLSGFDEQLEKKSLVIVGRS